MDGVRSDIVVEVSTHVVIDGVGQGDCRRNQLAVGELHVHVVQIPALALLRVTGRWGRLVHTELQTHIFRRAVKHEGAQVELLMPPPGGGRVRVQRVRLPVACAARIPARCKLARPQTRLGEIRRPRVHGAVRIQGTCRQIACASLIESQFHRVTPVRLAREVETAGLAEVNVCLIQLVHLADVVELKIELPNRIYHGGAGQIDGGQIHC